MLNIGWVELLIIAVVALFVVGPKQLPGLAQKLAKMVRDLTRARDEWLDAFRNDESLKEIRDSIKEVKDSASAPMQEFRKALDQRIAELEREKSEGSTSRVEEVLDESTELYQEDERPEDVKDRLSKTEKIKKPEFLDPGDKNES